MKCAILRSSVFFVLSLSIISCHHAPKVQEVKKIQEIPPKPHVITVNKATDDLVSFISGTSCHRTGCLSKTDSVKWKHYSADLDKMFAHAKTYRFEKMKSWAQTEFVKKQNITTLFYPFSGPDFLNADIFYPDADQYILIGQEPIGFLPDFCAMPRDSVNSYLNKINNSLTDIFKRSYFITATMTKDLSKTKVNGTLSLITLFVKRTGHQIVSIERIGVDSLGKWHDVDSLKNKNYVSGVKVDFLSQSKNKVQSVFYFRTDISDKGLEKHKGFRTYLSQLPKSHTFLKAASYLMHFDDFKIIRSVIFDVSSTILQDDSGIAYRFFDKKNWDIKLYGQYLKPKNEFSYIDEPDLLAAYKTTNPKPLPYTLGYNWRAEHSNLLYAIRKETAVN